jgi:ketosteroid isomerase-like protein
MRNCAWYFLISTGLVACAQVPSRPSNTNSPDSVVPEIAMQFSACNLDALMENYSANIEFVSPSTPKPLVGQSEARHYFSGACQGQFRPVMRVETQRVRMLSKDSAVVTGAYSFGRTDRPDDNPWSAFFVVTLKQVDGRWLINTQATFPIPASP